MTGSLAIDGGKPVRSKDNFLVFGAPLIEEPEIEEVVACMRRRWIGTGPKVRQFEDDFKAFKASKHAIALNSWEKEALFTPRILNCIVSLNRFVTGAVTAGANLDAIIPVENDSSSSSASFLLDMIINTHIRI